MARSLTPGCATSSNACQQHRTLRTTKRCCLGTARRLLLLLPENKSRPGGRGLWSAYAVSVEDERWSPAAGMSGAWLLCRKNGPVGPFHVADTDPPLPQRTYAGAVVGRRRMLLENRQLRTVGIALGVQRQHILTPPGACGPVSHGNAVLP